MSRFRKLSHSIWHCQYHIVWVPKYRHKILKGEIADYCRREFHSQIKQKELVEERNAILNAQNEEISNQRDLLSG